MTKLIHPYNFKIIDLLVDRNIVDKQTKLDLTMYEQKFKTHQ